MESMQLGGIECPINGLLTPFPTQERITKPEENELIKIAKGWMPAKDIKDAIKFANDNFKQAKTQCAGMARRRTRKRKRKHRRKSQKGGISEKAKDRITHLICISLLGYGVWAWGPAAWVAIQGQLLEYGILPQLCDMKMSSYALQWTKNIFTLGGAGTCTQRMAQWKETMEKLKLVLFPAGITVGILLQYPYRLLHRYIRAAIFGGPNVQEAADQLGIDLHPSSGSYSPHQPAQTRRKKKKKRGYNLHRVPGYDSTSSSESPRPRAQSKKKKKKKKTRGYNLHRVPGYDSSSSSSADSSSPELSDFGTPEGAPGSFHSADSQPVHPGSRPGSPRSRPGSPRSRPGSPRSQLSSQDALQRRKDALQVRKEALQRRQSTRQPLSPLGGPPKRSLSPPINFTDPRAAPAQSTSRRSMGKKGPPKVHPKINIKDKPGPKFKVEIKKKKEKPAMTIEQEMAERRKKGTGLKKMTAVKPERTKKELTFQEELKKTMANPLAKLKKTKPITHPKSPTTVNTADRIKKGVTQRRKSSSDSKSWSPL